MYEKHFIKKMKKSMDEAYRFNFRLSLYHKLLGVDFARCFEYSYCINKLNIQKHDRVLDVGSLKSCFPLFLAKKGANVVAFDIDERGFNQKKYAEKVGLDFSSDNTFDVKIGDARKIDFPDLSFDAVTCISTIEHIPEDGDIKAVKEFERILRPGGKVFISVPYTQKYQEGVWGRWFERKYNYDALQKRLIRSSVLRLKEVGFFIDHKTKRYSDLIYYKLPRIARFAFQWSQYFFAKHYIEKDDANKDDARIAWILLEKT